jgi:hypothetical protein
MLTVKLTVPQERHVGKNAEILILRHEVAVPQRGTPMPRIDEATAPAVASVFAAAGGHPLTATDTIHTPGAALAGSCSFSPIV